MTAGFYVVQCQGREDEFKFGWTGNLRRRLKDSAYTTAHPPRAWRYKYVVELDDRDAQTLEYLFKDHVRSTGALTYERREFVTLPIETIRQCVRQIMSDHRIRGVERDDPHYGSPESLSHASLRTERKTLRPYQTAIVDRAVECMMEEEWDRGILSQCCRTGKTLVVQQIMRRFYSTGKRSFALFVPTLPLLRQVCVEIDDLNGAVEDQNRVPLAIAAVGTIQQRRRLPQTATVFSNPTTREAMMTKWVEHHASKQRVIICTYQSCRWVLEMLKRGDISIDMAAFDEAHYMTCLDEESEMTSFTWCLENSEDIKRRLFVTGTEVSVRFGNRWIVDRTIQRTFSMDNQNKFGAHVAPPYTYARALSDGVLPRLEQIVPVVQDTFEYRSKLDSIANENLAFSSVVVQMILASFDAFQDADSGISHMLVYARDCAHCDDMIELFTRSIGVEQSMFVGAIYSRGRSESQNRVTLESYERAPRGVLFNVDMISVGVTIRVVDSVCLMVDMKSEPSIVQRIFRALSPNPARPNKVGRILLPCASVDTGTETVTQRFATVQRMLHRIQDGEGSNECERLIGYGSNPVARLVEQRTLAFDVDASFDVVKTVERSREFFEDMLKMHAHNSADGTLRDLRILKEGLASLSITTLASYQQWIDNREGEHKTASILRRPDQLFTNWVCWDDLFEVDLGYTRLDTTRRVVHAVVREHDIRTRKEYLEWYEEANGLLPSGTLTDPIVARIPRAPAIFYNSTLDDTRKWISWDDFLGLEPLEPKEIVLPTPRSDDASRHESLESLHVSERYIRLSREWNNNVQYQIPSLNPHLQSLKSLVESKVGQVLSVHCNVRVCDDRVKNVYAFFKRDGVRENMYLRVNVCDNRRRSVEFLKLTSADMPHLEPLVHSEDAAFLGFVDDICRTIVSHTTC